jgi:hypothetical protein
LAVSGLVAVRASAETNPPLVTVHFPNGGEAWEGGTARTIIWTATDDTAVSTIDLYYRDGAGAPWTPVARDLSNSGTFTWFVHNTPTGGARVRVVAHDPFGNEGEDTSNANFTIMLETGAIVPTTLRDFHQPGSQPFDNEFFYDSQTCAACHSFGTTTSPGSSFGGSMMGHALRDPIFLAALAIAEQDASSSGDLCLRCHTPPGWVGGRSNPTDGSALTAADRDGVSCHFCHKAVDPVYATENPIEDQEVLEGIAAVPSEFGNGMYVVDPIDRRRGPYTNPAAPHEFLYSPFHRSSDLCGTCHNVSNPAFSRVSGADYALNALDSPASTFSPSALMPIERTYSEWLASDFVSGVFAPEFAGVKADGIVSTCEDCHMADAVGKGCGFEFAPTRTDLGVHDMTGGNTWVPTFLDELYPGEVASVYLDAGVARATAMLQKSAVVAVGVFAEADSFRAVVTVTNRTGHKLPTGYPEGRRMWLNVAAYDGGGGKIYESGAYDPATGVLTVDPAARIYETHLGISPSLAQAIGVAAGPSFHFVLNDTIYKDNRIPPQGFTNEAYDTFGGKPVEEGTAGNRYVDGQNWDVTTYHLPAETDKIITTLYYQTTSKEYVEFLRDENHTNAAGTTLYDIWATHDRCPPVPMEADTTYTNTVSVDGVASIGPSAPRVSVAANPFRGPLALRLDLTGAENVSLAIYDVQGRQITAIPFGTLGGGAHRLTWDGRNGAGVDAGTGVFFAEVRAGSRTIAERVIRLE